MHLKDFEDGLLLFNDIVVHDIVTDALDSHPYHAHSLPQPHKPLKPYHIQQTTQRLGRIWFVSHSHIPCRSCLRPFHRLTEVYTLDPYPQVEAYFRELPPQAKECIWGHVLWLRCVFRHFCRRRGAIFGLTRHPHKQPLVGYPFVFLAQFLWVRICLSLRHNHGTLRLMGFVLVCKGFPPSLLFPMVTPPLSAGHRVVSFVGKGNVWFYLRHFLVLFIWYPYIGVDLLKSGLVFSLLIKGFHQLLLRYIHRWKKSPLTRLSELPPIFLILARDTFIVWGEPDNLVSYSTSSRIISLCVFQFLHRLFIKDS